MSSMRSTGPTGVCAVCGSGALTTDAVEPPGAAGWLLLGQCAHCAHRWTQPLPAAAVRAPLLVAAAPPEGARAA